MNKLKQFYQKNFVPFYPDTSEFTHRASFYGIPCYWNDETDTLAGWCALFDLLIPAAGLLHNLVIEPIAQISCSFADVPYEPCFPIKIWDLHDEQQS